MDKGAGLMDKGAGLIDKGAGLVIKFRVRIPQRLLMVLGSAPNLEMLLCYVGNPCSVASIVGETLPSPQKRKNANIGSSPGNKA